MDQHKFINLVTPFKDKVYRVAKRLLVSDDEAQDATQEVLLRLWTKRSDIKKYRSVEAFAMTMTKNYCYDKLKAKGSNNLKIVHNNYEDHSGNTSKHIEVADEVAWVFKLMEDLPEQQRLIVQMRDVEQMDNAEIAVILEMNETAVRVALSRARKKLREELIKKRNYGIS
ncbi:RNA polymerase sigma-70 factor (ECF subfamily) [Dokdonia sp. Hel_I_63]|jgi:RNA polymerase sigma factor (sigma-70 family)|uniref:RNA polymerase sigma factor n=1 Tax=unclassified Dokdonia TaxID=2615033 RepID=UPI00020A7748|nr:MULTISPECIES: sigma-70 family RNA polymerase sigma factor [unclassified Dokdonia]AEE20927.1 RNA polymerase, sigma-24 subunit, ECF subfamily [Dokdonia sp. 4H-3-7-5]TVZ22826.1 RNA polymerase sigma-70 factor (ECF subfamily) [Dokdonia sp. Hel_I_63]